MSKQPAMLKFLCTKNNINEVGLIDIKLEHIEYKNTERIIDLTTMHQFEVGKEYIVYISEVLE